MTEGIHLECKREFVEEIRLTVTISGHPICYAALVSPSDGRS